MAYALIENNAVKEYPIFQGDIEARYPNTSFPFPFSAPEGYELVVGSAAPQVDYTKTVTEGTPELQGGEWVQAWVVSDATPEQIAQRTEIQENSVRGIRDKELSQSDWTQLPDVPLSQQDKDAWATYRQELRDVTSQPGFPWDVVWPQKP